ncbi:hypothetical protein [Sedimenticola selenatireducens]|jgi:uncharacterized protein (DUF486 family)|uniref:Uncharacterized protein n=1 Tax=Sedimenticola selenatireducens TaxID=191960 RepID=A0A558DVP7_9GAMM|nr:hypothetical protein [Sedimenticola selenatireducens]TVO77744.1 hypothetical protein FHP88_02785 [Sedimenticola selenatireducens]TVT65049.1 MAG: hypothetical protein FHK78_05150 [Sedimenticola selenatireducens]
MWKITLGFNVCMMFVFWLLSYVVITPAYNYLVQYNDVKLDIPIFTQWGMDFLPYLIVLPLLWLIATLVFGFRLMRKTDSAINQLVSLHTSATLLIGLLFTTLYVLATILPILKFSAVID